jgi:hypothetical protein
VIESFSLPSSTSRVSLEYDGESFFRVIAINTGNREETLLVETEGPYRGEKLLIGDAPYSLDVEADGAWTIRIEAVDMADGPLESLDGMGDFVSDFFMPTRSGEVPYTFSHQGVENFRVVLRCADGEVTVQDTVGLIDAEGVVPFGEGPCLWIVEADDTWQIMPQE